MLADWQLRPQAPPGICANIADGLSQVYYAQSLDRAIFHWTINRPRVSTERWADDKFVGTGDDRAKSQGQDGHLLEISTNRSLIPLHL